jgi:cytosine/uracil/thiamine/allantoin permease
MRIGLLSGLILATFTSTSLGAFAAVASGTTDPIGTIAGLTTADAILLILALAILVQSTAINVTNLYTAGLSATNLAPGLGRIRATAVTSTVAVALAGFHTVVRDADTWVRYLGCLSTPLAGVIVAHYAIRNRMQIDVGALFEPRGRYRYWRGVNQRALIAITFGAVVYAEMPPAWLKAAWGTAVAALAYLLLDRARPVKPWHLTDSSPTSTASGAVKQET